jgi:outer membrane protein
MRRTQGRVLSAAFAGLLALMAAAPSRLAAQPMAPPPGVCRLTLEEAKHRALTHSKALNLARLNVGEKQHVTAAASKDFFPKILASNTYLHFDRDLGSVVTFQRGRLGILPPGGLTRNVAILNQDTNFGTILVAQPITKLIAVHGLVQISRADEAIAVAQLDKGTRDVLSGVGQAYYALIGAQRILSALQLQASVLEQLSAAQPSPELRISLVELRQGMVEVQGQAQDLTDQLNDLLNFPAGTILELVDPLPPAPPVGSPAEAACLALSCNPEIREAEQDIAKAEAALKIAKMDFLPDINVLGGYGNQTGTNAAQENFSYLGATASYTLWDWGKRRDVARQRQTQIALAHQNVLVTRDKVQLEARKAYTAFEQALAGFQLATEMAQARGDAEKGATTPAAAMDAKGATAKAELDLMKAEISYRVAHAQLMAAIGKP